MYSSVGVVVKVTPLYATTEWFLFISLRRLKVTWYLILHGMLPRRLGIERAKWLARLDNDLILTYSVPSPGILPKGGEGDSPDFRCKPVLLVASQCLRSLGIPLLEVARCGTRKKSYVKLIWSIRDPTACGGTSAGMDHEVPIMIPRILKNRCRIDPENTKDKV